MSLRKGIVVAAHPNDHSVDLVMSDDGSRIPGVPVMAHSASARTGGVDMPDVPTAKGADKWDITKRTGQDMEAVVAFFGRNPVVIGFLYPQVSQMTFDDPKRKFVRHQSDVYHTIDGDGNMELYHPSGAYVRIAENLDHEDLEKKNTDKSMQLDRNKDKKVGMRVSLGGVTFDIKDGVVSIDGSVQVTGDVVASGVSLVKHVHKNVRPGTGLSGEPLGWSGVGTKSGSFDGEEAKFSPIDYATGATRAKYGESPVWTGAEGGRRFWVVNMPADKASITEELFYSRFRLAQDYMDGGEPGRLLSEYNQESGEFTKKTLAPWNEQDRYYGEIPHGMLAESVVSPDGYKVYTSVSGERFALYATVDVEVKYAPPWYEAYVTGTEPVMVLYALSDTEFEENKAPPSV